MSFLVLFQNAKPCRCKAIFELFTRQCARVRVVSNALDSVTQRRDVRIFRVENVEHSDPAASLHDARHLGDRLSRIGHVAQAVASYGDVHRAVREGQRLRIPDREFEIAEPFSCRRSPGAV